MTFTLPPRSLPQRIERRIKDMGLDHMKAVWDAPANFNRHTRRAAGLFGRLWRWDMMALGRDPNTPSRYVRRHFDLTPENSKFTHPKTRRQRRHKARIMRAMKGRLA